MNSRFLFRYLVGSIISLLSIGLVFALLSFFVTGINNGFRKEICLSNQCFLNLFDLYSAPLLIMQGTLSSVATLAMAGGIIVALFNYINTAKSNALSNHMSHLSVFQNFLEFEVEKRPGISLKSVNAFKWYNTIFNESRNGTFEVSKKYISAIQEINEQIETSNLQTTSTKEDQFRYKPHQKRIIKSLGNIGIQMAAAPRNDFYETEGQVFSLITAINEEFCFSDGVPTLGSRQYI